MRQLLFLILVAYSSCISAQVNLVKNGDFEKYITCPYTVDQLRIANGWTPIDTMTVDLEYMSNPLCTAEYLNSCTTTPAISIPDNTYGYQYPHSGNGMVAMGVYENVSGFNIIPEYRRDYIQTKLSKPLTIGKSYCVSFFTVATEISGFAIKDISAYLDNGAIDSTSHCGLPQTQVNPQITNVAGPITDTLHWTKVEGSFIATGTERFITIGNFRDTTTTTKIRVPYNGRNGYDFGTCYFIDDVAIVESDLAADAGPDTHVANDSVYIGRPMSDAIWCDWRVLGSSTIIGQGPGINVKPKVRTRYVVTQNLCGNITRDTVTVDVWPAGVNNVNGKEQRYVLTPNPVQGVIHVSQSIVDERPVQLSLCEASGRVVYSQSVQFQNGQCSVDLPSLAVGFYIVRLQDGWGNGYVMKMVKQ